MPFKHKASLRYHIGKMKLRMTNRLDYEAGLHRRRSLSLWITAEALSYWQAPKLKKRGGEPRYSDLAFDNALPFGLVLDLRLRQTEGFVSSVLKLKIPLELAKAALGTGCRQRRYRRTRHDRNDVRDASQVEPNAIPRHTAILLHA